VHLPTLGKNAQNGRQLVKPRADFGSEPCSEPPTDTFVDRGRRRAHGPTVAQGAERIRTAVRGFAGLCLTTRPRRPAAPSYRRVTGPSARAQASAGARASSPAGSARTGTGSQQRRPP